MYQRNHVFGIEQYRGAHGNWLLQWSKSLWREPSLDVLGNQYIYVDSLKQEAQRAIFGIPILNP